MSVSGGLMAAGSLLSGGMGLLGASGQSAAAEQALQLEQKNQQQALGIANTEWTGQQANEQPFLNAGQGATLNLANLLAAPGSGLLSAYPGGPFTAPTLQQAEQQPGYRFQLQEGEQALQNRAAASGELLDPNASRAAADYAEGAAQSDYGNVYNQALNSYQTNFNAWNTTQQAEYNRLLGLSGVGENAAGQLGQQGGQYVGNVGNILVGGAQQQAQQINNAAAATASGYAALGGAGSTALGDIGTSLALGNMLNPATGPMTDFNPAIFTQSGYGPGGGPVVPPPMVPGAYAGAYS